MSSPVNLGSIVGRALSGTAGEHQDPSSQPTSQGPTGNGREGLAVATISHPDALPGLLPTHVRPPVDPNELARSIVKLKDTAPMPIAKPNVPDFRVLYYVGVQLRPEDLPPEGQMLLEDGKAELHWNAELKLGVIIGLTDEYDHQTLAWSFVNEAYSAQSGWPTSGSIIVGGTRHMDGKVTESTFFGLMDGRAAEAKAVSWRVDH